MDKVIELKTGNILHVKKINNCFSDYYLEAEYQIYTLDENNTWIPGVRTIKRKEFEYYEEKIRRDYAEFKRTYGKPKIEYETINSPYILSTSELQKKYEKDGWELVSHCKAGFEVNYIFKRIVK